METYHTLLRKDKMDYNDEKIALSTIHVFLQVTYFLFLFPTSAQHNNELKE